MPDCTVPWGDERLALPLPEDWTIGQVASPAVRAAPPHWADRLGTALARPEGAKPLGELLNAVGPRGRIALIVEDITRHSPLVEILPIVFRELHHAGIADEQVEVILATGMHPPTTAEEAGAKLGPFADRCRWRCNDAGDPAAHVSVGTVPIPGGRDTLEVQVDRGCIEADLRIVVSAVTPHLQAGFGGGGKMFVPGCASIETIRGVHNEGLDPHNRQQVGTEASANRMRQMIDAATELIAAAAGPTFAVQYLLDGNDLPSAVVTGDLQRGQRMLAKQSAAATGLIIESPADILITNAAPRDYDLWQCFKCIANTHWAARPNGVVIVLARCPAGANMGAIRWPLSPTWTRRLVRWIGTRGLMALVNRFMPRVSPEAHFFIRMAAETIRRNPILMYAPELLQRGQKFPGLPLYGDLPSVFTAADDLLGAGRRQVTVFTEGGASYPVMRGGPGPAGRRR